MKNTLKRLLAMALTISMVTSMVGVMPVLAANTSSVNQISGTSAPNYYTVGEGRNTTTVQYVYTAVVDVPEVDPPLTEIPEIEIPLTDVPQTGDTRNIALYTAIAMMSAFGLVWLTKTEYDEKKRAEN